MDFAFQIQDWMDQTFFFDPMRTSYPDYLGSYFKKHQELPAINSNGYTEGAASAYAMALRTGRDVERRRRTLVLGVRFAMQLQYESYDSTFFLPVPDTGMGGFRYNLQFARNRNDYSYHAMSTLSQALEFLRPEDYPAIHPVELPQSLWEASGEQGTGPEEAAPAPEPAGDGGPASSSDGGVAGDGGVTHAADAAPAQ